MVYASLPWVWRISTLGPSSSDSLAAKLPSNSVSSKLFSERLLMYTFPVTIYPSGEEGVRVLACTPLSAKISGVSGWAGSSATGAEGSAGRFGAGGSFCPSSGFSSAGLSSSSSVCRSSSTASRLESRTGLWPMAMAAPAGRPPVVQIPSSWLFRMPRAHWFFSPRAAQAEGKSVLEAVAATT